MVILLFLLWGGWRACSRDEVPRPHGVLVPIEPIQGKLDRTAAQPIEINGFTLEPQASFRVQARLLNRKSYSRGRESDLSPLDFAIGWGPMSDSALLEKLDISQSFRFFNVRWSEPLPIGERELFAHATNVHIIPADAMVSELLDEMRPGHVIQLTGRLVHARAAEGWRWNSSLTRTDTGAGACELMFVEDARIVHL